MRVRVEWKPQDCWIGAFWDKKPAYGEGHFYQHVWICLLPMLPIHLSWRLK